MLTSTYRGETTVHRCVLPLAVGFAAIGVTAHAHHSISRVYDRSQQVTVEGVVTEFRFVNPHPILIIDVTDAAQTQSWQLEMDNRSELASVGITAETFAPGDRIVVTGSRGRAESQSLYLRRLDRPADGARYEQIGSAPSFSTGSSR
jgi:hypothetical protein